MVEQETWSKASLIREHHILKKYWTLYICEELPLRCEEGNACDKLAVAVHEAEGVVVEHALREMSRVFRFSYNTEVPVKAVLHLSRSFTCNIVAST